MSKSKNYKAKPEDVKQEVDAKESQEEVKAEDVTQTTIDESENDSKETKDASKETVQDIKTDVEIEKLKKENADLQDKYLRLFAEFDNYRKRSTNELNSAKAKGIDSALRAFFPCMDSIDRAIAMCKDEGQLAGYKLVLKQFENALYTIGVTAIDPLGEEFDAEYHNAVLKETDPDNAGKVIQVLQKGYKYKDTLLRPAMVKIADKEE